MLTARQRKDLAVFLQIELRINAGVQVVEKALTTWMKADLKHMVENDIDNNYGEWK